MGPAGQSASPAPLRISGRCGVSPLEGVGRDAQQLGLRGKLSPHASSYAALVSSISLVWPPSVMLVLDMYGWKSGKSDMMLPSGCRNS